MSGDRPYAPLKVRDAIEQRDSKRPYQPIDRDTQQKVVTAFHVPLPGNRGPKGYCTDKQRYDITAFLCGGNGSSKNISEAQGVALIEWLAKPELAALEMLAILDFVQTVASAGAWPTEPPLPLGADDDLS